MSFGVQTSMGAQMQATQPNSQIEMDMIQAEADMYILV